MLLLISSPPSVATARTVGGIFHLQSERRKKEEGCEEEKERRKKQQMRSCMLLKPSGLRCSSMLWRWRWESCRSWGLLMRNSTSIDQCDVPAAEIPCCDWVESHTDLLCQVTAESPSGSFLQVSNANSLITPFFCWLWHINKGTSATIFLSSRISTLWLYVQETKKRRKESL